MSDPLFEKLSPSVRQNAVAEFREVRGEAGDVFIGPTTRPNGALYLLSGRVAIERNGKLIDASGPGEIIGEMSLFTGRAPVAVVRATEPTVALFLDQAAFQGLHERHRVVAHRFERLALAGLARRLRRLDALVAEHAPGERSPYIKPSPTAMDRLKSFWYGQPEVEVVRPRSYLPVEILYHSNTFKHLDPDVRTAIASEMKLVAFPRGTFLCTQGEPGDAMFMLALGQVDVFVVLGGRADKVHRLGEISDGTLFGITALMDDRPRMASCIARTNVEVLTLPREHWKRLYAESTPAASALRQAVIAAFADQVEEAGRNLVEITAPHDTGITASDLS